MGNGMAAVLPLGADDSYAGRISTPGEVDQFEVTIPDNGRLTATVQPCAGSSLTTRLSLLGPDGQMLIQSDGQSPANLGDQVVQHILGGTYFVQVQGLGSGIGTYTLTTQFQPANPPNQSLLTDHVQVFPFALSPWFNVTGDFNGDGTLDIATANTYTNDVTVLLGRGDGTFHSAGNFGVGNTPFGMAAGDFNGDGILDLAVVNQNAEPAAPPNPGAPPNGYDVSILLGNGDGTFQPERRIAAGNRAWGLAAADLTGNGRLDLVIANQGTNDISVLIGNGDGTFQPEVRYPVGDLPNYIALGDFNHDGHPDLAVSNFFSNTVSILLNKGDGTFVRTADLASGGKSPSGIVAGDFNEDGNLDLAVANDGSGTVGVLFGNGNGTFQSPVAHAVGESPVMLVAGDFSHDGHLDLAVANRQSNDVSVLRGRGDGTFQDEVRYRAGLQPVNVLAGDLNGDGNLDLATANLSSHDVSILLGKGDGTFQDDLTDPRRGQTNPLGMVAADFNRDGIFDLATVTYTGHDVLVYLGRGDGTFGPGVLYPVGSTPVSLIATDLDGDGKLDLVTSNCDSGDISVLRGDGDGTFQREQRFPASASGEFLLAGDFTGHGHLDLIDSGEFSNGIALIPGNGDGTFQPPRKVAPNDAPARGAVGDFNGDGHVDLAVTNFFAPNPTISVFLSNGDGTFQPGVQYPVGDLPFGIVAGDFNRDGTLDLAVADTGSNAVSILVGRGDGTFRLAVRYSVGVAPDSLVAADLTGNGILDLVVSDSGSSELSILLGRGDGSFQDAVSVAAGDGPTPRTGLIVTDFNRDGIPDIAASGVLLNSISVLLGRGDGTFQAPLQFPVGFGPAAFTTGDFNNDGRLDVSSVNPTTNEVHVSLGLGDATLQTPVRLAAGSAPVALVNGDYNRDGRLDLAVANYASNDVSVLLGLGDGTFRQQQRFAVGTNPVAVAAGDFNGDGLVDLATADAGSNDVSILLGRGDGTFQSPTRLPAGDLPDALVTGDFNGDGTPDLAVANYRSRDVWVYLGRGDGTFADPVRYALGTSPVSLVVGDFLGNGVLGLATANYLTNDVSVLLGGGDGTFQAPVRYEAGTNPVSVVTADLDDDGHLDLATANSTSQDVSLLLGRGDGTFAAQVRRAVGDYPASLAGANFADDGHTDLALATQLFPEVSILQGLGNLRFVPGGTISNPIHATPLVADFNGDGLPDVAVVGRQGKVLLRLARPDAPGTFAPPVAVNPDPDPPARAVAVISTPGGQTLAALDAGGSSLSFYRRQPDGTFTRQAGPTVPGTLPGALAAGDLNGDGLTDLVVADAGSDEVLVYLQTATGGFGPTPDDDLHVGVSPSALDLVDVDGDGLLDIVVANQFSGDVSVLHSEGEAGFTSESRFRAGTGLYWLEDHDGKLVVTSREGTAGLVAGDFGGGSGSDLVAVNSGANSFSVLTGDGAGGFLNPSPARTYLTGLRPTVAVAGRFTVGPNLDLAVLDEGSGEIAIFLGDGHGGFARAATVSAGNLPTGLAVADVNGDGIADLLVGNDFGDVLTLLGNGDGTFQPYRRAGRNVALAVADLTGTGRADFVFADEALDRVSVSYGGAAPAVFQDRQNGLLAPSAVSLSDLNGDGIPDLVVANGGGNNILVYPGLTGGGFGPEADGGRGFFVGTNPVSVTVQDLNGDGLPDLTVANQGSNDVSVLLGERRPDGSWTLTPGPRLDAHGAGPDSTAVRFVPDPKGGPALPHILVANGGSNNVVEVPGVGNGFFDDRAESVRTFATGQDPQQVLVGRFQDPNVLDFLTVNAGSNDLTLFPGFGPGRDIASGGDRPVAAAAGDFNHDGLTDLVVAHNGDGVIALLLGEPDGPALQETLTRPGLAHPTAVELSPLAEDTPTFYVTEEGEEQATPFVLTFFGIPVPGGPGAAPPPAVPNPEFTLLGPGFPGGLNIPSTGPGEAGELAGREAEQAEHVLGEVVVALVGSPLPGGVTGGEAADLAAPAGEPLAGGGADEAASGDAAVADDGGDLPRFLMGLPEALPGGGPGAGQDRSAALDALFGRPLPDLARDLGDSASAAVGAGLGPLRDMTSAAWAALEPLGVGRLEAPALRWRQEVDALFQAGMSEVSALGDAARRLLSGEDVAPAPGEEEGAGPPVEEARPPEAAAGPEAAAADRAALAAHWAIALLAAAAGTAPWADRRRRPASRNSSTVS
jgi:hypothetical protein